MLLKFAIRRHRRNNNAAINTNSPTSRFGLRLLSPLIALVFVAASCSLFDNGTVPGAGPNNPAADDGDDSAAESSPAESTVPPLLELSEAASDPAFDGGNTDADATAAMEILLDNELDFSAPGLADGLGGCPQINGAVMSEFLGEQIVVGQEPVRLTTAPSLTCVLKDAADADVTVGYVHVSPDDGGFASWFLTNPAAELAPLISPGDTAGWNEGIAEVEFFSILVIEQGGTQAAIEFRTYRDGGFTPGRVPGMVGALAQATADLAA